jgi:hypothetical protein
VAGGRPDPALLYAALAELIDPAWTRGHSFSVEHQITGPGGGTWYLHVTDGGPVGVFTEPPEARPAARVRTSGEHFHLVLEGSPPPPGERAVVGGDVRALGTLAGLIARAVSGSAEPARQPQR